MEMLRREKIEISGRRAVVVGRSDIVGKPMAQLLLKDSCTVTIAHSRTKDLPGVVRRAVGGMAGGLPTGRLAQTGAARPARTG